MDFITSWVTNIILFILLAAIVEMLLPQTSLQKYVKMVLGLLLIIMILSPIFKLFSLDTDQFLSEITKLSKIDTQKIEKSLEEKKIEIQAEQYAYILEQTAVQLKDMTEKELMDEFGYQFTNIKVDLETGKNILPSNIENILNTMSKIYVSVEEYDENVSVEAVKTVEIDTSREPVQNDDRRLASKIKEFLARNWGVDMEMIEIKVERRGGR